MFWESAYDYFKKGQKNYHKGNYKKAISEFTRAVKEDSGNPEYYYWLGLAKQAEGLKEAAIIEYSKAIIINKDSLYYATRAKAEYESGKYDNALQDITISIKAENNNYVYLILLGDIQKGLGNFSSALITYNKAYSISNEKTVKEKINDLENCLKTRAKDYFNKGKNELDKNNPKDAVLYFEEAKKIKPNNDNYLYWCGIAKYKNDQDEEAIKDFDKAIELNPKSKYFYYRGHSKYFLGNFKGAINDYTSGLNNNPKDKYNYYEYRADAKRAINDINGAIEDYYNALENGANENKCKQIRKKIEELNELLTKEQANNEDSAMIKEVSEEQKQKFESGIEYEKTADDYYEEGQTYLDNENYEQAIKCFEEAINLDPDEADNYYWCGYAKYCNDQNKVAIKDLTAGIKLKPDDICDYYDLRGDIYNELGKYNLAKKDYTKAIDKALDDFDIDNVNEKINELAKLQAEEDFEKGKKYHNDKNYEKAIEYFSKAKDTNPDNDEYFYWCGYAKYWNDQDEEAIKDFNRAIELNPIPKYYYRRGHSKYFLGKYEEAIEDYNIGISKNPEDFYNYYELMADAKKELRDIDGAIENYQKALIDNPDEETCKIINNEIDKLKNAKSGSACSDCKNTDDKKILMEIDNAKIKKAEHFYQKGMIQYGNKEKIRAIRNFTQAIKYNELDPKYHYWLANTCFELNQPNLNEQFEHIKKAIELDDNNAEYYKLSSKINEKRGDSKEAIADFDFYKKLKSKEYKTCEQEEIFTADKGKSFLVNAGPGTGKTYTLIQKIKYLVTEEKISEDNILVLSHTNAAVNEIKNRLNDLLADENIKVQRINIRTICSFVKFAHSKIDKYENKNDKNCYRYSATEDGFTKANMDLIRRLNETYNFKNLLKDLNIKYFIADEIQDAVDTVGKIILELTKACIEINIPVTLFGDECQAIFDFEKDNIDEKYKMPSTDFYEKIKNILKQNNNTSFASLKKNMRQKENLAHISESLKNYREAILNLDNSNDYDKCENYLQKIKNASPNNIDIENIDISEKSTHCILTHSNNRALYIASKLQKHGIQVYVRTTNNKIQFEYHEWIAKVLNHKWDQGYIIYEDFKEFVTNSKINLPINYKGYDKTNHAKSFFKYLNNEILDNDIQDSDMDISINQLKSKLKDIIYYAYYEIKCDGIFKSENKCNIEVSTIHKAKGREFDFVHIDSGCCEGDYFNNDKHKSMYVAVTRPKYFLDFVDFDMYDFDSSQRSINIKNKKNMHRGYGKKIDLLYVISNKKLAQYKVLYNDIDLRSFEEYQQIIQGIQPNEEIVLRKESNSWIITCKNQTIGKMKQEFAESFKKIQAGYPQPKKITNLRIDGIWSVFDKEEESGNIKVWNVISFCGFGDAKYER